MRQLKYYLFLTVLLFSINAFGQRLLVKLNFGEQLYSRIYEQCYKHINELEKLHQQGILFVRFDVIDGQVKNLKFSKENPKELVALIKTSFEGLQDDSKEKNVVLENSFILPIIYDYMKITKPNASDLLMQIPDISIDSLNLIKPNSKSDFEIFTSLSLKNGKINALPCYFLPWIKLEARKE